jgi:hypothetical protein
VPSTDHTPVLTNGSRRIHPRREKRTARTAPFEKEEALRSPDKRRCSAFTRTRNTHTQSSVAAQFSSMLASVRGRRVKSLNLG